jgi:hypothetical protein
MARFAKTVLATAMLGAGMTALVPGVAMADEHHHGDEQTGLANVDDVQTIVPVNACNNNVPVNVLGVQVPLQDVVGNIPIASPVEHGSEQAAGVAKECGNGVAADNG